MSCSKQSSEHKAKKKQVLLPPQPLLHSFNVFLVVLFTCYFYPMS